MTAQVLIWAALHYGGMDGLTFDEALDIAPEDVQQVEVPEDRVGPKGQTPKTSKRPDSNPDAEPAE